MYAGRVAVAERDAATKDEALNDAHVKLWQRDHEYNAAVKRIEALEAENAEKDRKIARLGKALRETEVSMFEAYDAGAE